MSQPTSLLSPDLTLLPARMLNEYAYCPRLCYLEWVQGEFADSVDTLDGRLRHQRVDQESGSLPPSEEASPEEDTIHARSVSLSSETLGLSARIDLVELEDGAVTPVDYKRGKPARNGEPVWESDAVQLCVQALLLREHGYHCTHGIIYYSTTKQRLSVEITPELITHTREAITNARSMATSGHIPPPLVDSPKCVRCSLAGICLPDEVNTLMHRQPSADIPPRRLIPASDDIQPLYVQEQGAVVGRSGELLQVKQRGDVIQTVRIGECSHVLLHGSIMITAQAMATLTSANIPICHFSTGGWFHSITTGMCSKNIELRQHQFAIAADPSQALAFARAIVSGKIRNSRTILRRNHPELPDAVREELQRLAAAAATITSMESLLGLEGAAARLYFRHLASCFKLTNWPQGFDWQGRNRRPPTDPINAILSYLYSLLVKDLTITTLIVGFDPYLGFYHRPRHGRPALALDLAEEFRSLIADSVALTVINRQEITWTDFIYRNSSCALKPDARKRLIAAYERRMSEEIRHPLFGYTVSYRRILEIQARLLAYTLLGQLSTYPPFKTR